MRCSQNVATIRRISNKEHNRKNKKNRDAMDYVVDNLITAALPTHGWGKSVRCFKCISEPRDKTLVKQASAPELVPDSNFQVTAAELALLAVIWENCEEKWRYVNEMKQQNKEVDTKNARYTSTPYTSPSSGNCSFGGWFTKGWKRFSEFRAMFAKTRH